MQGIEPKLHNSIMDRMKYYHGLLKEPYHVPGIQLSDVASQISELEKLYEDYLVNKKQLEDSIKNYRQYHNELRKSLNIKLRELRRKVKQNQYHTNNRLFGSMELINK